MKNKEFRLAANGFTSISTKISAKDEIYTSTCVVRKRAVNVMTNKTTGDVSPTVSALSNALLLSLRISESATGKAIRLYLKRPR
jgi:hypothetical protein